MNIAIIGLGLIGGSIGRALVKKTSHNVYAFDISADSMLKGSMLNAYHYELNDENIKNIDILIIGLYPRASIKIIEHYAKNLRHGATILDCGGVKKGIVEKMEDLKIKYPYINFVATHPMAGREYSGIKHSSYNLFDKASILVIPIHTDIDIMVKIKDLFLSIGADRIVITNADYHDKMIAYTSQLAHIVSSAYIKNPDANEHYGYSAGSFKDMTRVAKLNPDMWTETMLDNRLNLLEQLDIFIANLQQYRQALAENNEQKLKELLAEGNSIKEEIESQRQQKLNELQ